MERCRLDLLGTWRLGRGDAAISVRERKGRALLTRLALGRGHALPRESAAALLWSGTDARARASLRQCLSGLRTDPTVAALLHETPDGSLALPPERVEVDLHALLARVAAASFDDDALHDLGALPNALDGLRGLSEDFDAWIDATSAALRDEALAALARLHDDPDSAPQVRLDAARAALALDPLREAAVRAVMEVEAALGSPASALRFYDAFHARLERDLDAEPALATQDLAVAIKLGRTARTTAPAAAPEPPRAATLAALPLEPLGPGTIPRFVLIGLLDRITAQLAALPAYEVISGNSTRHYLGERPRLADIHADLGADYALTGSLTLLDGRAHVSAELAETRTARVVWAETLTYPAADVLALRAPLAEDVARIVAPSVDHAELRRVAPLEDDALGPYQMVLRARDLLVGAGPTGASERFEHAGELLRRAARDGPRFALAHLRLAEWHSMGLWEGRSPDADRAALETHAREAMALRPRDGRALAFWAHARFMFEREHDAAITMIDQALDASSDDAETLVNCVVALAHGGQPDRAVALAERALRLSPLDPFLFRHRHFASVAHYAAGDHGRAADLGLAAHRAAPDYRSNLRATIAALVAADRVTETAPLVADHARLEPRFSVAAFVERHGFRHAADRRLYGERLVAAGLPA